MSECCLILLFLIGFTALPSIMLFLFPILSSNL